MGFYLKLCHLNSSLEDRPMKSQQGLFNCVSWQDSHSHTNTCSHTACLSTCIRVYYYANESPVSTCPHSLHTHLLFLLSSAVWLGSRLAWRIMRNGQFSDYWNGQDWMVKVCQWWTQKERVRNTLILQWPCIFFRLAWFKVATKVKCLTSIYIN